jgi:hypothetical protein
MRPIGRLIRSDQAIDQGCTRRLDFYLKSLVGLECVRVFPSPFRTRHPQPDIVCAPGSAGPIGRRQLRRLRPVAPFEPDTRIRTSFVHPDQPHRPADDGSAA